MEHVSWLERVRTMSEDMKRLVVVIGTAVTMSFVLFVWLAFFNNLFPNSNTIAETNVEPNSEAISFWDTARAGAANALSSLGGLLGTQKTYILKPDKK